MRTDLVCAGCGAVFRPAMTGPLPKFCGMACRRKFDVTFKQRRAEEERRYAATTHGRAVRSKAQRRYCARVGIERDHIVANRLKLPKGVIPQQLIDMKREQLRLHRLAKKLQQAATKAKENDEPV